MFEIIEDDLTPEIIEKFSAPKISSYKVYFDPLTSSILSITNELRTDLSSFFEVELDKILPFLQGKKDPAQYKVVLNPSNTFEIISIVVNQDFKSSMLVPIKLVDHHNSSLTVQHNKEAWIFTLSLTEQKRLTHNIINYWINIFVTARNNKNMLYRTISLDLAELVKNQTIAVPFNSEIELDLSLISISTVKFLESYGLINESKI